MNHIEHVKQEKSNTELSKRQRILLTIVILFESVALCLIIAAIVYIFSPEKELPVSGQEYYTQRYHKEASEQQSINQEDQIKKYLHQEQVQTNDPAEQKTVENKQSKMVQEQQQSEDKEIQTLDTHDPDSPDLSFETGLDDQESRVAGAVYPKPGIDPDKDIDPDKGINPDKGIDADKDIALNKSIDPDKPMLALTFDDGPYEAVTNRILDILEQYDARATFFVLGLQVETHAETLQRIHSLGCQIGNHSYNHKYLHSLPIEEIRKEIDDTNNLIREITGIEAKIVRPPYGAPNDYLKEAIPYPLVMWNVDPKDWKSLDKDAVISEVVGKVKDGDIVILHDNYPTTADACEIIIPRLIEDGFQFVTVDEMMRHRNISMTPGKAYYNAHIEGNN
ncbi:MAG: polysaccharide deacetylase family protein [Clostridiaceae bacterium]|nr:polysaccharide deacetylase family protein [Clostridiaceae bacterium]